MSDVVAELRTARGLAMVFLAAVVVASFVMVVVTARGETPVTKVSAEDFSQLSLDSGVAVQQQLALDLCGNADTEVRCLSEITKVPGSVGPSGDASVFVPSGGSSFLTPADLQEAYHIPDGGSGATIAVVSAYGYDAAQIASDLEAYRDQYGLAPCDGCLTVLNQNGHANPLPDLTSLSQEARDGWAMETALDLDMVSATCPSCSIELYLADSAGIDDMASAVQAASQSATYVSMSWGAANASASVVDTFDAAFGDGVLYFASSGDDGYGDVEYPAVSSRVIGVGGTALYQDLSTPRLWREQAWTGVPNMSKKGGPGSGCNTSISKPVWQQGVVDDAVCTGAVLADISAVASHDSPVVVHFAGNWYGAFGTSVAAPIVAGIYAAAGITGNTSTALSYMYENPDRFHDIVAGGRNVCDPEALALCVATAGWDGPTGIGTPDGTLSFDPGADPVSDGSGGDGSDLTEPTIAASGSDVSSNMTPNGGTVVATLSPGDPLDLSIDNFGDYDDIQFNISLAFEDGDGEQLGSYAVPSCVVAKEALPDGLDLSGCVLSGSADALGNYAFSLEQDADGNLVLTVTVTPPPGTSTTPTSTSGTSPTTASTTDGTASTSTTATSTTTTSSPTPPTSTSPASTAPAASTTSSSNSTSSTSTTPPAASTISSAPATSPTPTTSTSPTTPPAPPDTSGTPAPTTTSSAATSNSPPPSTTTVSTTTPTTTSSSPATTTTSTAASIPAPPPPASLSLASPPAPHRKAYVVDVTIKVVLADLVGTGPDGGTMSIEPSATILRDILTPGKDVTQADAITVLSQLPTVEGLTPAYTPQAVAFIRLAKLVTSLLPFDLR